MSNFYNKMKSRFSNVEDVPQGPELVQEDAPSGQHDGEGVEVEHIGKVESIEFTRTNKSIIC